MSSNLTRLSIMKLYLDDLRKCPVGWTLAQTADEAIELLKTGKVEEASLDHDLAEEHYSGDFSKGKTGYDVVCWMEANNVWPSNGTHVHSLNPVGREKMYAVIRKYY